MKQLDEQRAAERKELQRAREARWREREERLRQEAEARKKREEDLAERRRKAAAERRALQKQIDTTRVSVNRPLAFNTITLHFRCYFKSRCNDEAIFCVYVAVRDF